MKAHENLAAMLALKDGVPREKMEDIIQNDVQYLMTIVAEAGTFGAAVLYQHGSIQKRPLLVL